MFAGLSLNDAYALSLKHALAQIRRDGGTVRDDRVEIATQAIAPVAVEQLAGHFPVAQMVLRQPVTDETTFSFDGVGFVVQGSACVEPAKTPLIAEVSSTASRRRSWSRRPPTCGAAMRRSGATA